MKKFFLFSLLCLVGMGSAQAEPYEYTDGWKSYFPIGSTCDGYYYATDWGIMFPAGSVTGWLTQVSFYARAYEYTAPLYLRI